MSDDYKNFEKKSKKFYIELDKLLIKYKFTIEEAIFVLSFLAVKTCFEFNGDLDNYIKNVKFIFDKLNEEQDNG